MTCFRQTAARRPTGRTAGRTAGEASQVRSTPAMPSKPDRWPRGPPRAPFFSWRSRPCGPARERTGRSAMPFAPPLYAPGETPSSRGGALAMSPYTHARTLLRTARLYLRSSKARGALLGPGTGRGNRKPPREGTAGARPSRVSGAPSKRDSSTLSLSSRWSLRSRPLPNSNLKDSMDEFN